MRRTPFQAKPQPKSDQPHSPERGMPVASDNDVIMDGDAQRLGDCDNVQCHLDVLGRGRRIARRVIVKQSSIRRYHIEPKRFFVDTRSDWGMGVGSVGVDRT